MSSRNGIRTVIYTATSPAAAGTAAADPCGGLELFDELVMDISLAGATGGTLDVYLQREVGGVGSDVWTDWYRFAQVAAAGSYKATLTSKAAASTATVVGGGTLAAPGVAVAATTLTAGVPLGRIRYVFVAGAGTSVGAAQTIRFTGREVRNR